MIKQIATVAVYVEDQQNGTFARFTDPDGNPFLLKG
ncbi:hypothetical protein JOD01_000642 [Brevibacillus fulvus]|uniref:Glyoxalase n=1 Tax=Brevibacillus fulvus TaxID=1125967 RepID=A0A938XZ28_9BACL|nr:hypothetical protein [Brevibacillus fulvus]